MKSLLTFSLFLFIVNIGISQNVEFEDDNFKNYLISEGLDTNDDGEIQLTEAAEVTELQIPGGEEIVSITGIKSFINIESLIIEENLSFIVIDNMLELESLEINNDTGLTEILNARNCPKLSSIVQDGYAYYNYIDFSECISLEKISTYFSGDFLDLSNCVNLKQIVPEQFFSLPLTRVNGCINLEVISGQVEIESYDGLINLRKAFLNIGSRNLLFEDLPVLDSVAIFGYECNNLTIKNCPQFSFFEYNNNFIDKINFDSNEGMINLDLTIEGSVLNISNFSNLETLDLTHIGYISGLNIDILSCDKLEIISAHADINYKDVSIINCKSLKSAYLSSYMTNSINAPKFELSGLLALEYLLVETNVKELGLNSCPNVKNLELGWGDFQLESLDVSQCINLETLEFYDASELKTLILNNGTSENIMITNAPKLEVICVDEGEENSILEDLANSSSDVNENVIISTNCPFSLNGKPFKIFGKSYLDIEGDSCKTSNLVLPYSKYKIDSEELNFTPQIFANANGDYQFGVKEGTYSYEPVILYGNDLFITIPENNTATFPDDSYEIEQDFCFIPQLEIDIVEVTLIALNAARPGFESDYKVIFKNIGNVIKDGEIKVNYQEELMDLVVSNPGVTSQEDGLLTWSFEDLVPYEKRELYFTMVLNTPMDDPALVGGEFLEFEAVVSPLGNQTVSAYWSDLSQEVVNSFDPNDKTCLDGMILDPEDVGDYLKYMIRFENTGTASAVNVVVKDTIDQSKFDIETLEVIDASHLVEVSSENNEVSFIFRNIELPFEDEFNDGYVVFKIKTKDDLVLGDDIQNRAGIYFDFNFPIITNTASTLVSVVSSLNETDTSVEYQIAPNPADNKLILSSKGIISKYRLTSVSGELVLSANHINNKKVEIDTSDILPGIYFIKFWIDGTEVISKVIKF